MSCFFLRNRSVSCSTGAGGECSVLLNLAETADNVSLFSDLRINGFRYIPYKSGYRGIRRQSPPEQNPVSAHAYI